MTLNITDVKFTLRFFNFLFLFLVITDLQKNCLTLFSFSYLSLVFFSILISENLIIYLSKEQSNIFKKNNKRKNSKNQQITI
jgi:hypothetical protein